MKLMITTQYMENYGAHDWDGEGECPQYWKMKGGEDYFFPLSDDGLTIELMDTLRAKVEWSDQYSRQYVIGTEVVEDDYMTEFERSQLEYEGKITYPAKTLEVA